MRLLTATDVRVSLLSICIDTISEIGHSVLGHQFLMLGYLPHALLLKQLHPSVNSVLRCVILSAFRIKTIKPRQPTNLSSVTTHGSL
jgi:hypothetical protein